MANQKTSNDVPLPMHGWPDGFHTSLGRFISQFALVETALFLLLTKTARVPLTTAQAIFSDARIDKAKDTINRLRNAHGIDPDPLLDRAFSQLGEITRVRNDLCHYGVMANAQTGELMISNALLVTRAKIRETPISVEALEAMIYDLETIKRAMSATRFQSPITPAEIVALVQANASQPWRYKPHAPSPSRQSTRGKRRERPIQRQPSAQ